MAEYRLGRRAAADLDDIWRYTVRNWLEEQAEIYHDKIMAEIQRLAAGERDGRKVEGRNGYFKHTVESHFVIYRRTDEALIVVRILHQRRDLPQHL